MSDTLVWQIIVAVVTMGANWGAIRAEVRGLREMLQLAQTRADDAHKRIDKVLEG